MRHKFTNHGKAVIQTDLMASPPTMTIARPVQLRGVGDVKASETYELLSLHMCPRCQRRVRVVAIDRTPTPFREWMLIEALEEDYDAKNRDGVTQIKYDGANVITSINMFHRIEWCWQIVAPLYPRGAYAVIWTALRLKEKFRTVEHPANLKTLEKLETADNRKLTALLSESPLVTRKDAPIMLLADSIHGPQAEILVTLQPQLLAGDGLTPKVSGDFARLVLAAQSARKT